LAEDPNGKLVWDMVALKLGAQAASQTALVGRAKDLLGVATIATTITGVILNDKLFAVVKGEAPLWWTILAAISLAVIYGAGLWAMQPAEYSFAPDAEDFYVVEQTYPASSQGEFYRSLAEGYLLVGPDGESRLGKNQEQLERIELLVRFETMGIAVLGILAFLLAFVIEIKAAP
jgi:hypothetical protein